MLRRTTHRPDSNIRKISLLVACLAVSVGSEAIAEDMTAPPLPATATYDWSGCYAGLNAGAIVSDERYSLATAGGFLQNNNLFSNPANSSQVGHSFASHATGFTGGGQIGCNKQIGILVLGVEADFDHTGQLGSTASFGPAGPIIGANDPARNHVSSQIDRVGQDGDWYSTIRGRVGLSATPTLLLYATGGFGSRSNQFCGKRHIRRRSVFSQQQCVRRIVFGNPYGMDHRRGNGVGLSAELEPEG